MNHVCFALKTLFVGRNAFVSVFWSGERLVKARSEMLKQVQDDIVLVFIRHGQDDEMINVERLTRNRLENCD